LARLKPVGEEFQVKVETSLNGRFNLMNTTAAFAALQSLGAEIPDILFFLKRFQKVRRRLELVYRNDEACVYDDFAHHPTAVGVTLEALCARRRPGDVLVAIFEPASSSSRRKEFENWYAGSFSAADLVLIAPVKRDARIELLQQLDNSSLARRIGPKAHGCESYAEILKRLKSLPAGHYQFVFFSSGSFGGLPRQFADFLARRLADVPGAPRLLSPK
jgi:UDP-N-acetylmuramate: L-alanyl-gamma-D-glutamyl-meso-diaminopimelate ligase